MSVLMFGNRMHVLITSLSVSTLVVFASACAPVIIDPAPEVPRIPGAGVKPRFAGDIVIMTAGLEKNDDLIDPEELRAYLELLLRDAGAMPGTRVIVAESAPGQGFPRAEIVLSRMDYTIEMLRPPPSPPCGLPILYPFISPVMLARQYFRPQAVLEGTVILHGADGSISRQQYLSESALARAGIFNTGGEKTRRELTGRAISRFSRSAVRQFYP